MGSPIKRWSLLSPLLVLAWQFTLISRMQKWLGNISNPRLRGHIAFTISLLLTWESYEKKSELVSLRMRNHKERQAQPTISANCQIGEQSYLKSPNAKLTCQVMAVTNDLRQNQWKKHPAEPNSKYWPTKAWANKMTLVLNHYVLWFIMQQ